MAPEVVYSQQLQIVEVIVGDLMQGIFCLGDADPRKAVVFPGNRCLEIDSVKSGFLSVRQEHFSSIQSNELASGRQRLRLFGFFSLVIAVVINIADTIFSSAYRTLPDFRRTTVRRD